MFDLGFIERLLDEAEDALRSVETAKAIESSDSTNRKFDIKRKRPSEDDSTATDQARRDDCTVLILGLHPSTDEREVYAHLLQVAIKDHQFTWKDLKIGLTFIQNWIFSGI